MCKEGEMSETPTATFTPQPILARPTTCIWCKRRLTDGRLESGWTGTGPDWMDDGDFGCGESPNTGEDGTGRHIGRASLRALLLHPSDGNIYTQEPLDAVEVNALMERITGGGRR